MLDFLEGLIILSTWALFIVCAVYKPLKKRIDLLVPMLLMFEYSIWPVWFLMFPGELPDGTWSTRNEIIGYIANIIVYSGLSYFLLSRGMPKIVYGYIAALLVVVLNLICVTTGAFQFFWDHYQALMVVIMAYIVLAAIDEVGHGGKRTNTPSLSRIRGNHGYRPSVVSDLARHAWG